MAHGGDVYTTPIEYDFSVNLNPMDCREITETIIQRSADRLAQYPDYEQREFRQFVALSEGVEAEELWGGNGASELFMAIVSMVKPKKAMLIDPGFVGYRHALDSITKCEVISYRLDGNQGFVLDETFLEELKEQTQKGLDIIFIANPNNPVGCCIPRELMEKIMDICRETKTTVVIDECFSRMSEAGYSMSAYIGEYENLFIVNAYTKLFAIPGVRVGYVISNKDNISRIRCFLPEWNMSVIAQTAGVICSNALINTDWEMRSKELIRQERAYLTDEMNKLGYKTFKSDTNFILFQSDDLGLFDYLYAKQILIRNCDDFAGLTKGFYRIAVRKHSDNEALINALKIRNN